MIRRAESWEARLPNEMGRTPFSGQRYENNDFNLPVMNTTSIALANGTPRYPRPPGTRTLKEQSRDCRLEELLRNSPVECLFGEDYRDFSKAPRLGLTSSCFSSRSVSCPGLMSALSVVRGWGTKRGESTHPMKVQSMIHITLSRAQLPSGGNTRQVLKFVGRNPCCC